jgi:ribA/ribD-fused uncharacterized protein
MEKFTFFYRTESPFSQFHPCVFEVEGVTFNCAEQFMMYSKAKLFGDDEVASQILTKEIPKDQKALGRQVKNFDDAIWQLHAMDIVYKGSYAKFTQNENLKKHLLKTEGTTLVEASPMDAIWGIGLPADNPKAQDRKTWRGKNQLGEILTKLREDLLKK